jgi:hypothetical protein
LPLLRGLLLLNPAIGSWTSISPAQYSPLLKLFMLCFPHSFSN